MRLLTRILDIVVPPRPTELLLRTLSRDGLNSYLCPRAVSPVGSSHSSTITALSLYSEPNIRAAVMEAKFHGNRHAARMLGKLIASYIECLTDEHLMLIPVPLSSRRRKERGYNQVERIVTVAVRLMPSRVTLRTDILVRSRDTAQQTSLGRRDRVKNIKGAFEVRGSIDPHHSYIVLDDVTTTGSTLTEAVQALRAAGARNIIPIALGYQPIGNVRQNAVR